MEGSHGLDWALKWHRQCHPGMWQDGMSHVTSPSPAKRRQVQSDRMSQVTRPGTALGSKPSREKMKRLKVTEQGREQGKV